MKKFLILMVILAIALMPTMSFAEDLVGDNEYNSELDIEEVKYILEVDSDTYYKYTPNAGNHNYAEEIKDGDLLYVVGEHIDEEFALTYLELNTEKGIRYICDIYADDTNNDSLPQLIMNKSGGSSQGAGQYKITFYCSACNTPPGTGITASGIQAYVGSAASNDFSLGTVVHVEGYGDYTILDRMGSSGVIDIFTGYSDACHCSGIDYVNVAVVG